MDKQPTDTPPILDLLTRQLSDWKTLLTNSRQKGTSPFELAYIQKQITRLTDELASLGRNGIQFP